MLTEKSIASFSFILLCFVEKCFASALCLAVILYLCKDTKIKSNNNG